MKSIISVNARTGEALETVARESSADEVNNLCSSADAAAPILEQLGREFRATMLSNMASAIETRREEIVATADRETAIGATRLGGELTRTCHQLRLFAEVLREGSYLEATIDPEGPTPMGPRPDLRRMLVPIGPVAVFGASNFPLAFSVPGGDTASALAAGCPVIVKAHSSHPATSRLCFDILAEAAASSGAPEGTLGLVFGQEAGGHLVANPYMQAVGFTGSVSGGKALLKIINDRPDPIPFYGELSSLNPIIISPGAAANRTKELGQDLVNSFTLAAGQLCTKPGLVFVPEGSSGDELVRVMIKAVEKIPSQALLNERIHSSFIDATGGLQNLPNVQLLAGRPTCGKEAEPMLFSVPAEHLNAAVTQECFGPVTVIARYGDDDDLLRNAARLPSSLTATVHSQPDETELVEQLTAGLSRIAGRMIYNGFPTGVAVSWAQHHGGPWPSTNSLHTSVGATAIRRFVRPFTWQDAPTVVLPRELQDAPINIPRRIDGQLFLPSETVS